MTTLLLLLLSLLFSSEIINPKKNEKVVSIFGYNHHENEDGTPSRDDSKYYSFSCRFSLNGDVEIIQQKGRLSPKYKIEVGKWSVINDKIEIKIESIDSVDIYGKVEKDIYSKKYIFSKKFEATLFYSENELKHQSGLYLTDLYKVGKINQFLKLINSVFPKDSLESYTISKNINYKKYKDLIEVKDKRGEGYILYFDNKENIKLVYISETLLSDLSLKFFEDIYGKTDTIEKLKGKSGEKYFKYLDFGFQFYEQSGKILYLEVLPKVK